MAWASFRATHRYVSEAGRYSFPEEDQIFLLLITEKANSCGTIENFIHLRSCGWNPLSFLFKILFLSLLGRNLRRDQY